MASKPKRTRRSSKSNKSYTIDTSIVGWSCMCVGLLYFFAYILAPSSPLMTWFHQASFVIFGQIGTYPFFGLMIVMGIAIVRRNHLAGLFFRQYMILVVLISTILNFPILDNPTMLYTKLGGYISRPILRIATQLFGNNPMAIKTMIAFFTLLTVGWIIYSMNISVVLPSISLISKQPPKDTKPQPKAYIPQSIPEKSQRNEKQEHQTSMDALITNNPSMIVQSPVGTSVSSGSLLKTALGSLITKRVDDTIHEKTMTKISFAADIPTFPLDMLKRADPTASPDVDHEILAQKAHLIQKKLAEFNVPVTVDGFDIGPSIIQIRLKPEAGIKISTIENLKQDITLATKSKALRIVAPIPGTDCVGIQIPRPKPVMVHLADVLGSADFEGSMHKSVTNLTLGKAIDGSNSIKALEEMPHLLIAGATGSGKSVGVNTFILSLIYQNTPSDLKFLMIDPKQVELELYSGIPYLLAPIVTQPDKALKLLQRSVNEMEARYTKLSKNRCKKLSEYNEKFPEDKMFRIVIVVDELADLMMSGNKKEVELCITRIAQKARAVGMHLIVATQRPSVNVITGLIKANIPTRIAFGVVSQIDSRTILGVKGAEDLLGKGDLLYMDTTTKQPLRIQGPYADNDEIESIIASLKATYMQGVREEDMYHPEILRMLDSSAAVGTGSAMMGGGDGDDEVQIEQAIQIISETRKASATLLQRKLGLGFARAARIMDELENRGVVGPADGAKPREIYI